MVIEELIALLNPSTSLSEISADVECGGNHITMGRFLTLLIAAWISVASLSVGAETRDTYFVTRDRYSKHTPIQMKGCELIVSVYFSASPFDTGNLARRVF